jgi:hypothetical protein
MSDIRTNNFDVEKTKDLIINKCQIEQSLSIIKK